MRERICHLLRDRDRGDAPHAVPALLELLREPHAGLRCEAADAIRQIAEREGRNAVRVAAHDTAIAVAGALTRERDPRARAMLAGALGALRHEPAIPHLIALLADDDWLVRSEGASALGALRAAEGELGLQNALARETDSHAAAAMRTALATITGRQVTEHPGPSEAAAPPRVSGVWSPGGVHVGDVRRGLSAESS